MTSFGSPLNAGYFFFFLYRLIHIFCHKYSFVLFYIIVIWLEAWLLNYRKSSKKYKIKRKNTFTVNTKYMSSRELKTSKFSLVLRTRENYDVFSTLDEIYLVFTSKSKYPLYSSCVLFNRSTFTSRFMTLERSPLIKCVICVI